MFVEKENDEKLSQINALSTQKEAIGQTIKSTIITVETGKTFYLEKEGTN